MVDFTNLTTLNTSMIVLFIGYGVAFVFQLYMLYLNWKQSKVKNSTEKLVEYIQVQNTLLSDILEEIREGKEKDGIKSV